MSRSLAIAYLSVYEKYRHFKTLTIPTFQSQHQHQLKTMTCRLRSINNSLFQHKIGKNNT